MTKKCVIVQHEAVHEEIIASIILVLNNLNFIPHIYINADVEKKRGDIFVEFEELKFSYDYVSLKGKSDWNYLKELIGKDNFEFVVSSTFQRPGVAKWITELNLPILGCVHNVNMFKENKIIDILNECEANFKLFSLGAHVTQTFNSSFPDNNQKMFTGTSSYWPTRCVSHTLSEDIIRVGIPGGVNFANRNFSSLLDTLVKIKSLGLKLRYYILGGGKDRERLIELVNEYELSNYVEFLPIDKYSSRVMYDTYVDMLSKLDFIDPLSSDEEASKYTGNKITSAWPTALGASKPIYTNFNYSTKSENCCFGMHSNHLQAIIYMANINREDYSRLASYMLLHRNYLLKSFELNLANALVDIGVNYNES